MVPRSGVVLAAASLMSTWLMSTLLMSACASTGPAGTGPAGASSTASASPDAGSAAAHPATEDFPPSAAFSSTTVYVARRRWHVDVGFAAEDLRGPLVGVLAQFPGARYAFFGFGDRHYLLSKDHDAPTLLEALWPGPGLILLTALENAPRQAFGVEDVIELRLTPDESRAMQAFIWHSLSRHTDESAEPYAPGPYPGSTYFAAVPHYSGLHTCITWAAEALRAGGLPVRSRLTLVAGQLWRQILKLSPSSAAAGALPPPGGAAATGALPETARAPLSQSQGGGLPFSQTAVPPCGTTTVVLDGGFGLLLLMQPASSPAANTALTSTFMSDSCSLDRCHYHRCRYRRVHCGARVDGVGRGGLRVSVSPVSYRRPVGYRRVAPHRDRIQ